MQHSLNIPRNSSESLATPFMFLGLYPTTDTGLKSLPRRHEASAEYSQRVQREALNTSDNVGNSRSIRAIVKRLSLQDVVQTSDGLSVTLERLENLLFAEAEEGFPLPTRHAYRTTRYLLEEAHRYLLVEFPRATVSVEENGGIFVYWIKPSNTVQLTVPSESGKLLYLRTMQSNLPSQVCQNPDGKEIARRLLIFNRLS